METENNFTEDYQMADYLLQVLSYKKLLMMSWGFDKPIVITDGLQFDVSGFKHKGKVQIIYQHGLDLFMVKLLDYDMNEVKSFTEIYVDQLSELIDEHVEKVENYNEKVKQTYFEPKSDLE